MDDLTFRQKKKKIRVTGTLTITTKNSGSDRHEEFEVTRKEAELTGRTKLNEHRSKNFPSSGRKRPEKLWF